MSAYHRNVLVERFRAGGGELPHTVVVGIGAGWYDLDTVPEREPVDAGGAGRTTRAEERTASGSAPCVHGDAESASSPDTDPDPQVEGEAIPLFENSIEKVIQPASPYDPSVEAA